MVKLASILAVLYLAASPAMSVGRLVHALELCPLFQHELAVSDCHGHSHDRAPDSEHSHGNCHQLSIESGAIPIVLPTNDQQDAPQFLLAAPLPAARPLIEASPQHVPERPPPLAPHIPTTLLLI